MPKISILLPTHQSGEYLQDTLKSIFDQTYQDYELLIVDDASTDQTLDILGNLKDYRVHILQGKNCGLAEALNWGIQNAKGEYIARIDADDIMVPKRLEKQIAYMELHPDIAVCGGWQQYFGLSTFLHTPPASTDQCRSNLLFRCDLCHSTLMLRKSVFINNNLFYNPRFAAEDFELWTRVLDFGEITNLPEVLGYYREDGKSLTAKKKNTLIHQNGEIVAASLERNLKIRLTTEQQYFAGWINPFYQSKGEICKKDRILHWEKLESLLLKILNQNRIFNYYNEQALLKTLRAEWLSLRYNLPFILPQNEIHVNTLFEPIKPLDVLSIKIQSFNRNYQGINRKYHKIKTMLCR